jgi:hypothetical protein
VSTEPKNLAKSKTQSAAATRWYIGGGDEESDSSNLLAVGGRLHHAATQEMLQPTAISHSVLSSVRSMVMLILFK